MAQVITDPLNLEDYMGESNDGENIRPAASWLPEVVNLFHGTSARGGGGALLPWSKTHDLVHLRAGEVTLWHGQNFSGKSLLTSLVALDLCWQRYRVCIASLEMPPPNTMARMARQATGTNQPHEEELAKFHTWTDDRLWLYDRRGQVSPERMLAVIRYSADKLGINHFFVDSLMKCVRGEDSYNEQKDFVNGLCTVAHDLKIHVHLIHHTKKQGDDNAVPGRYDAKGSGSISDQVDNVIGVWRNRRKADERPAGDDAPDALLNVDKQRNGEWDGKIALWFDAASYQYRGAKANLRGPRKYLSDQGA